MGDWRTATRDEIYADVRTIFDALLEMGNVTHYGLLDASQGPVSPPVLRTQPANRHERRKLAKTGAI